MNTNKILSLIGSKWFIAIVGVMMLFLLPTTYGNFMVVYKGGAMSRLWWIPIIFIINVLTAIIAFYKASGMFFKKKESTEENWD